MQQGDRVLLAVSGGADSVALLRVMLSLRSALELELAVAHLDHGLRGTRSEQDREFVRTLAQSYGLPVLIETLGSCFKTGAIQPQLEGRLRQARYQFLLRASKTLNSTKIATAHTADDQLETVLMRLVRGAGLDALSGIRYRLGSILIRPLLEVAREQVLHYLTELGQAFRDDHTNRELIQLRTRIRHCVVPELRRLNPRIHEAITRGIELSRIEAELLKEYEQSLVARCVPDGQINLQQLRSLSQGARYRVLRTFIMSKIGVAPTYAQIVQADSVARREDGTQVMSLPGNYRLIRTYSVITIEKHLTPFCAYEYLVAVPGTVVIPEIECEFRIELSTILPAFDRSMVTITLNPGAVGLSLMIRSRRPGDVVRSRRTGIRKKLKSVLIKAKVPRLLRARLPVLANEREIVWTPITGATYGYDWDGASEVKLVVVIKGNTEIWPKSAKWEPSAGE